MLVFLFIFNIAAQSRQPCRMLHHEHDALQVFQVFEFILKMQAICNDEHCTVSVSTSTQHCCSQHYTCTIHPSRVLQTTIGCCIMSLKSSWSWTFIQILEHHCFWGCILKLMHWIVAYLFPVIEHLTEAPSNIGLAAKIVIPPSEKKVSQIALVVKRAEGIHSWCSLVHNECQTEV